MSDQRAGGRTSTDGPQLSYDSSGSRQVRATALGRGTHGVPDVRRLVESQFHVAFPHRVWVAGEVGTPFDHDEGLRFALHASTGEDAFSLPCVVPGSGLAAVRELLHRTHDADVEDVVREGRLARVGGLLRFDALRGSVVFVVSELDPSPTAIELADAREVALQAVADAGLGERQRARVCGPAPLDVAVVGGAGSSALDRVRDLLAGSVFDVRLQVLPVVLTGSAAPALLAQAVRAAAQDNDVVLLVRDEGRPLGLAAYDALEAVHAVAEAGVPVVTGLGGAGVGTACDQVAHAAVPTAEAAARWVLARLGAAERGLQELTAEVDRAVVTAGQRCRQGLQDGRDQVARAVEVAAERSEQARRRRRLWLRTGCALVAVLAVVVALVTGAPWPLAAVVLALVVLVGAELWWKRAPSTGRRRMSQRDDEFTRVLERLHGVREELDATSSPEKVSVLRELAADLVAQGEALLTRSLEPGAPPRPDGTAAAADDPDRTPDPAPATARQDDAATAQLAEPGPQAPPDPRQPTPST